MKKQYQNTHQELLDACRKNDNKAQFEIYRLYAQPMYSVCVRMVNDKAEAEDILQEAFLKVFSKIKSYKQEVSFGAWAKRIVINTALDFLKRKKLLFEELDESRVDAEENDTLPEASSQKQVERIKECLAQLPDGYRVIATLVLFEGYDHDEVAQILDISASTSRSQFARAKRKLLNLINQMP